MRLRLSGSLSSRPMDLRIKLSSPTSLSQNVSTRGSSRWTTISQLILQVELWLTMLSHCLKDMTSFGVSVCQTRNCQSYILQCHHRWIWIETRAHSEADLQADSSLLQLVWNCSCPCSLSVCAQVGIPRRIESSHGARLKIGGSPLLFVISVCFSHSKFITFQCFVMINICTS